MKPLLCILVFTFALALYSTAQNSSASRKEMNTKTEKEWKRALKLTAKQYESLKIINRECTKKRREIRSNIGFTYDQQTARLQMLQEQRKTMINTLLTEEQRRKLSHIRGEDSRKSIGNGQ